MIQGNFNRKHQQYFGIGAVVCIAIICLGNFSNPPNGYTGAPGDDLCDNCHSLGSGMQNGSIVLNGLPATIIANQTYTLTVTVSNPNGLADFAGFQTVILDANNQNAGTFSMPSSGSALQTSGGRTYHEHSPAQMFGMSNAVSWTVNWQAPIGSGLITYYGAGNVANGNGNSNGDLIVTESVSGTLTTPLQVEITQVQDVTCFNAMDGSITAAASFGEPPYTYQWSNGGNGATIMNLDPGEYTVTVTDSDGATGTASAEVMEPPELVIVTETIHHVSCNGGSDGQIILVLDGGVPPYSGAQGDVATFSNLAAGDHTIMITDANGCLLTAEYTITEPEELTIQLAVIIEPECNGDATGLISIEGSGGTGTITYEWSNGGTTSTIQNLEAGVYTVTITDDNSCTATETVDLNEPDALQIDLVSLQHVSCNGGADGEITIDAFGGTGSLSYLWSNGSTSPSINDLVAGSYTVTVTDANGCTETANYIITQPTLLFPNATATGVSGPGEMDGTATSAPSGGTGSYTFLWSNGETTATITGLGVGTYTVTVTDGNACTAMQTVAVTGVNCTLAIQASATDIPCFGEATGTAQVTILGAMGSVNILWSNGDTTTSITNLPAGMYSVMVIDSLGCVAAADVVVNQPEDLISVLIVMGESMDGANDGSVSCMVSGGVMPYAFLWSNGDTTSTIMNLAPGTYFLTITDGNGCTQLDTAIVNPFSCALQINLTVTDALCFGDSSGAASVIVSGGTGPYAIVWSDGSTGESIDSVPAGTYALTITDADTCVMELPFTIGQPAALVVAVDTVIHAMQGGGGAIQITISGGTPPYTTIWTKNGGLVSTNEDPTDLTPGDYQLEILDDHQCMLAIGALTVTVSTGLAEEPDALGVSFWPNPANDFLLLSIDEVNEPIQCVIYSSTGTLMRRLSVFNDEEMRLDISDLARGLYCIRITDGQREKIMAFVKM